MANTIFGKHGSSALPLESDSSNMHPLISWRSVIAGLLIAFFCMVGFLGLGLAFGGISMDEDTSAKSMGIFTGAWFLISVLLSIFVGSYFAARVSKFQTGRIGSAQGLVIAALFLGFFLYHMLSAIGSIGSATGSMIGKGASMAGAGIDKLADNPAVGNMVEDAVGDLNLRADPKQVATGVTTRLIRGDTEGAKNYLSRQSGITPEEANMRITQLKTQLDQTIDRTKEGAATALKSTGWSLFLLVVLGALSAIFGGSLGSVANYRKPLSRRDYSTQTVHA
jgi:hypothetical protein